MVGIEPGTNYPFNRRVERKAGRLQRLGSGESKQFKLSYTLHDNPVEIKKVAAQISELSEGFAPEILDRPPPID